MNGSHDPRSGLWLAQLTVFLAPLRVGIESVFTTVITSRSGFGFAIMELAALAIFVKVKDLTPLTYPQKKRCFLLHKIVWFVFSKGISLLRGLLGAVYDVAIAIIKRSE